MTLRIDLRPACSLHVAVRFLSFPWAGMGMGDRSNYVTWVKATDILIWCVRVVSLPRSTVDWSVVCEYGIS